MVTRWERCSLYMLSLVFFCAFFELFSAIIVPTRECVWVFVFSAGEVVFSWRGGVVVAVCELLLYIAVGVLRSFENKRIDVIIALSGIEWKSRQSY